MKTKIRIMPQGPTTFAGGSNYEMLYIQILTPEYPSLRSSEDLHEHLTVAGTLSFQRNVGEEEPNNPDGFKWYALRAEVSTKDSADLLLMAKILAHIEKNCGTFTSPQPAEVLQVIGAQEYYLDSEGHYFIPVAMSGASIFKVMDGDEWKSTCIAPNEITARRRIAKTNRYKYCTLEFSRKTTRPTNIRNVYAKAA